MLNGHCMNFIIPQIQLLIFLRNLMLVKLSDRRYPITGVQIVKTALTGKQSTKLLKHGSRTMESQLSQTKQQIVWNSVFLVDSASSDLLYLLSLTISYLFPPGSIQRCPSLSELSDGRVLFQTQFLKKSISKWQKTAFHRKNPYPVNQ